MIPIFRCEVLGSLHQLQDWLNEVYQQGYCPYIVEPHPIKHGFWYALVKHQDAAALRCQQREEQRHGG